MSASSSAAATGTSTAMSTSLVVLVLSLLLGIQPITTDLYLPALPALTADLQAPVSSAQLTLTALLLAFGVSQMIWGPLSDRFGRRPILLAGMVAYVLASIGCSMAGSMTLLVLWRAVQGAAMGAAVMCARAIVRDLYTPEQGARAMSRGLSGLGVIACLATLVGGAIADAFGWRAALAGPAIFGVATLALLAMRFEETLAVKNARALEPGTLLRTWAQILGDRAFLAYSALTMTSYAGLFTFLATSPFVFLEVLGLSRLQYGMMMFAVTLVYIVGTIICRRLLPRLGLQRTVAIAGAVSLSAGSLMGLLALAGVHEPWAIIVPHALFMLGHGVHQPCGQSAAVAPFPHAAGAASALNGFLMMLAAFAVGAWIGPQLSGGTVYVLTNGVWFWSVGIALAAWVLVRRYGRLRPH
ncbi:MAG TPA: multidrug effflux MFS transporter [Burkholderiaceae bacterium]|nr:multidrug effflux MFS transporter [Burkholderiaceae bacterium]